MIIRREALAAALELTDSEGRGRYALDSVCVEPSGRVVATEGRAAIAIVDNSPIPDSDFPLVPGAPFHASPASNVLLTRDVAKRLLAVMPKRNIIPVLGTVQLSTNGTPETVTAAATDLQAPTVATIRQGDRDYPTIDRILSSGSARLARDKRVRVGLSVKLLERVLAAVQKARGASRGDTVIELVIPTAEPTGQVINAITFKVAGAGPLEVSGVIMPYKLDDEADTPADEKGGA